jgi:hypothetical protein
MKKSVIALSVAAALGAVAGPASAQTATTLEFNERGGVGHILYVPYFSTQKGNVTAISIVNTDTVNGKVLKVRFRGASNSDDLYDFQVFLSPADVWTAAVTENGSGGSQLTTDDASCTLPLNVEGSFITSRVSSAGGAGETKEGYVEILTMADIVNTTGNYKDLYDATKHVSGVAPCDADVLTALTNENASTYMTNPTTGISANWAIINVDPANRYAYGGEAAAIEARVSAGGAAGTGNIVYWDQRSTALTPTEANANTADPLLRGSTPAIAGARYDLPDLSTPYTTGAATPFDQANALSAAIAAQAVAGEFSSLDGIGAQTDWVISFPTRRYYAAVKYGSTNTVVRNAATDGNIYFTADNTELGSAANGGKAWQICAKLGQNAVKFYDREETGSTTDDIVISPGTPTQLSICGEVAVVGINNADADGSATFGRVARSDVDVAFDEGWGLLSIPLSTYPGGLPLLASQFLRVANTTTSEFYGIVFPARVTKKGVAP